MQNIDYINGLLSHNKQVIDRIYKEYFNRTKYFVQKHGGTLDDAKDVFQEAIIVIYNKAKDASFELTSKFSTYLFGICRFIWLNLRKKKSNNTMTLESDDTYIDIGNSVEQEIIQQERYQIYEDNFLKLGELCQKILRLFFINKSMQEIADAIGYKTSHSVRSKKYSCQQKLKEYIKSDDRFSDFNVNAKTVT